MTDATIPEPIPKSGDGTPRGVPRRAPHWTHGIEVLLKKASVDARFADVLLESPDEAARLISLDLQDSERTILRSTPRSTLRSTIRNTRVLRQEMSAFRTMSAALMLAAVIAASSLAAAFGCEQAATKGIAADDPASVYPQMVTIQAALESYWSEHGVFLTTDQWYDPESPLNAYLRTGSVPDDPWGNAFQYEGIEQDGKVVDYLLQSYGPDGVDSDDDIECSNGNSPEGGWTPG